MSYTPRSLFRLLEDIDGTRLLLPHIQRPFVWELSQTERLFDSLMRDYPIQTFLFWRTTEQIRARRFMPLVDADLDLSTLYDLNKSAAGIEKTFVLDGQQRLQSLHSMFRGGQVAPDGKTLEAYFDVTAGEAEIDGDLRFSVRWEAARQELPWFRIRDLSERYQNGNPLEIADQVNDQLEATLPPETIEERKSRERRVRTSVTQLHSLLNHDKHFWVDELDGVARQYPYRRILEIFVRVNSGGTKLTAGDLMFAAMKEGWDDIEARVEQAVDLLNGGRLAIDNDFVLKALLLANGEGAEVTTAKFDGDAGKALLKKMEASWDVSEEAFRQLRDFAVHQLHLHSDKVVRSYNALIPLFMYFSAHPKPNEVQRTRMAAYFHKAQLFGWFGSQTDNMLNVIAGVLRRAQTDAFPLEEIATYFRDSRRLKVEIAEIDLANPRLRPLLLNIAYTESWGNSPFDVAFKGNEPHIDHIYPQHMLRSKLGAGSEAINDLGNLRFVGAIDNIRKRAELPADYFGRLKKSNVPIAGHLLVEPYASEPSTMKFDIETFRAFRAARRQQIFEILKRVVNLA